MKIELADYDPQWNNIFLKEKELLKQALGGKAFRIEHIGSTAVPGLGAKPIIDILLGVKKLSDADEFVPDMISLGYEYVSKFEDVMPERRYFVRRDKGNSTHHVHTVEIPGDFARRHLLFRDYLRTHDDTRDEYYKLKKELAGKEWNDSNDYAYAKTDFIRKAEKEAFEYVSKKIEIAEIKALYDLYHGAPDNIIKKNNVTFKHIGKALAIRTDSIYAMMVNRIIGLGNIEEANLNVIEEALNFYKPHKNIFGIQISPTARPENLPELLIQRGMFLKSKWNKFYRTTEETTIPNIELNIREIGVDNAKDYAEIVTTVFGMPPALKEFFESVVGKKNWHHYMAFEKEILVASGSMYIYGDTAWFGMAVTLPEYRGKGAQCAVISARINKARETGCKWISVETAGHSEEWPNPSYMNMLRYGFNLMYRRSNFVHEPQSNIDDRKTI